MKEINYSELKKGGFMRQVQKGYFSMRLRVVGGRLSAEQLKKIYEVANKYGRGYVHLTARQGVEIPFIKLEDIEAVKKELSEAGLEPGACGPRVRTITACQGSSICPNGIIDTTELANECDKRYYAQELPHKFKIGITGCGNNCLKAEENDLGIKGAVKPEWEKSSCTFCGLCQAVCPTKAIQIDEKNKEITIDRDKCTYCGRCVKSCPTNSWKGKPGYLLHFGGMFGNNIALGKQILPILFSKEDVHKVIQATLEFYKKYGKQGERFRNTIERVGWDIFKKELEKAIENKRGDFNE
ncbi:4Fe-4S dicluster domain-containing protein [Caldicellulosiruptor changbaiensis]|uniref:4Fe-4S dicluster domain-containing protein n=1 Tax=Caldicellulosiruptor changbaiensis TaxID=1222016 RepID=A0A3T0D6Z5_9FIRM|nr:4Fe-4S binding protein [Caldicellulosiruptor changbaiensis]AZT90622.1 4Fe-4S dicluster domain-containing protein [Caldicellulosiruptor changbaiensis]